MKVKAASLFRIIDVVQFLESFHHSFHVGRATLRRLDVEDLDGLVEGHAGGEAGAAGGCDVAVLGLGARVFAAGLCLLVGFAEGAGENTGADEDDLGDESVGLGGAVLAGCRG